MKREQIENFLIFVNVIIKTYYDNTHKILDIIKKNIIYLRLHYNYKISNFINYKLHNQRVDLFKMFNRVERLIYRLKLFSFMKIHFVVFVT